MKTETTSTMTVVTLIRQHAAVDNANTAENYGDNDVADLCSEAAMPMRATEHGSNDGDYAGEK